MSTTIKLPSGEVATRFWSRGEFKYALHGTPVNLTRADVEALYADSIAGDGGRELRGLCHQCERALDMGLPVATVVRVHGPDCRNDRR